MQRPATAPSLVLRPSFASRLLELWPATVWVFAVSFLLIFAKSMATELNSDEHPFVTCGVLWSRHGLIPYRDFHYNHLPTLVLIYGLLFKLTDHLLLASRIFSCVCAAALVAVLFHVAMRMFGALTRGHRWLLGGAVAIAVLTNPLLTLTSGLAWNHDFPTLLTVLSYLAVCRALRPQGKMVWAAIAGVLIGLAFTSRLTFGPAAAALAVMVTIAGGPGWRRAGMLSAFLAGSLIGSIPAIWIIAQDPENALWGNLLFPRLNTAYHASRGAARVTPWGKAWFLLLDLLQRPGNGLLVVAAIVAIVPMVRRKKTASGTPVLDTDVSENRLTAEAQSTDPRKWEGPVLIVLLACLWLGCVFPTPLFRQYMFAPMPLFVLVLVVAWRKSTNRRRAEIWLVAVAVLSLVVGGYKYFAVIHLANPARWHPIRDHAEGLAIRDGVGSGRVLTLGPALVLEGGLDIYPELATGPYAYRVTSALTPEQRRKLVLVDAQDIKRTFATNPPQAILTGFSKTDDKELISLARSHGFQSKKLPQRHTLWTIPKPVTQIAESVPADPNLPSPRPK